MKTRTNAAPLRALLAACSLAVAVAAAGCAVMQVDVDVYKGPLSNQNEVQMQQVTAMAMGAKPLLVQLRDRLEEADEARRAEWIDGKVNCQAGAPAGANVTTHRSDDPCPKHPPHVPGYIRQTTGQHLLNDRADRVNSILSLYLDRKDIADTPNSYWHARAQAAIARYQAAAARLKNAAVPKAIAPLSARPGPGQEQTHSRLLDTLVNVQGTDPAASKPTDKEDAVGKLSSLDAQELLSSDAFNKVWNAASTPNKAGADAQAPAPNPTDPAKADKATQAAAEAIATSARETQHDLTEAREAMADLVQALLVIASTETLKPSHPLTPFIQEAIPQLLDENTISSLSASAVPPALRALVRLSPPAPAPDAAALRTDLQNRLRAELKATAIAVSAKFENGRPAAAGAANAVRSPLDPGLQTLSRILATAPFSVLDGGRGDEGLETLIRRYIDAVAAKGEPGRKASEDTSRQAMERLTEALVHFAQKMAMLGNMADLVDGHEDTSDSYTRMLQAVSNSILTQIDDIRSAQRHKKNNDEAGDAQAKAIALAWQGSPSASVDALLSAVDSRAQALGDQAAGETRNHELANAAAQAINNANQPDAEAAPSLDALATAIETAAAAPGSPPLTKEVAAELRRRRDELIEAAKPLTRPVSFGALKTLWKSDFDKRSAEADDRRKALQTRQTNVKTAATALLDARDRLETSARERPDQSLNETAAALLKSGGKPDAAAEIGAMPRIYPRGLVNAAGGDRPATEVLDAQIALLRMQQAHAAGQSRKEEVAALGEAIRLLQETRTSMIYVRPASTYLRNSYPVTSLQGNPPLMWTNLLGRYQARLLPFYGEAFNRKAESVNKDDQIKTLGNIDKQFWQSINRVRLAGGGDTNYALMRDDIGNWVVKNYSTDKKEIFQSAKNLALFAMKAGSASDFVRRPAVPAPASNAGNTPAPETLNPSAPAPSAPGAADRQLRSFDVRALQATVRDYKEIRDAAGGFQARILAQTPDSEQGPAKTALEKAAQDADFVLLMNNRPERLEQILDRLATATQLDDLGDLKADAMNLSVPDALRACRRYCRAAEAFLPNPGVARNALVPVVNKETAELARKHRSTLQTLEGTLSILDAGTAH